MGGCRRGAWPVAPLFGPFAGRKEKRREKRKEGKEKNGKSFQTWKFLKKIKDNL
jgi:hypothetical protein